MIRSKGKSSISLSLIFLAFIGVGAFAAYERTMSFVAAMDVRSWSRVECTILKSSVGTQAPYAARVSYTYQVAGQPHTSDVLYDGYDGTGDYYDAQKIIERYPAGSTAVCRVNPADPSHVVLELPGLWSGLMIAVCLLSIAIGMAGLLFTWRAAPPGADFSSRHSRLLLVLFFSFYFLIAGVVLASKVPAFLTAFAARNWPAAPCVIISTDIDSRSSGHHSSNSAHYFVTVLFGYDYNGKPHKSSRNAVFDTYYRSPADARLAADALLSERNTACFVNPADPDEAILDRTYAGAVAAILAIAAVYLLAGAGAAFLAVRSARMSRRHKSMKHASLK